MNYIEIKSQNQIFILIPEKISAVWRDHISDIVSGFCICLIVDGVKISLNFDNQKEMNEVFEKIKSYLI